VIGDELKELSFEEGFKLKITWIILENVLRLELAVGGLSERGSEDLRGKEEQLVA
jgi:hypothetical protein